MKIILGCNHSESKKTISNLFLRFLQRPGFPRKKGQRVLVWSIFLLPLFLSCPLAAQSDPEAIKLIRQVEEQMRGSSNEAVISMSIVRPDYTRNLSIKSWSLGEKFGLTIITAPAKEKGMAFLKRDKEMWNWQPSIDRMIKMPPSMLSQGWMGSDLSTEDLVRQNSIINDYTHKLKGTKEIQGVICHIVELIPKSNSTIVWGKILMYVSKTDFLQYRVEFFDEDFELVNTMNGYEPKTFGKRKLLSKMEIIPNGKPGNKTIFKYDKMTFDIPLKEDFFSIQNLKKMKV